MDVKKAGATVIDCANEQCVGKCTPELLKRFNIEGQVMNLTPLPIRSFVCLSVAPVVGAESRPTDVP